MPMKLRIALDTLMIVHRHEILLAMAIYNIWKMCIENMGKQSAKMLNCCGIIICSGH